MENEVRLIDMNTLWQCDTCFHNGPCGCKVWCDAGETYRPAADKLKIIDPESLRPKGRWIVEYDKYCEKWRHTCNRCTHSYTAVIEHLKPYCSCCGAKMEG